MSHAENAWITKKVNSLIACLALLLPVEVWAIDTSGKWNARGIGAGDGSCGEYVREDYTTRRSFEHWMMGFISGVNRGQRGKSDYSNKIVAQGLVQWIENYCTQNPLSSFSSAVDTMLDLISEKPQQAHAVSL